MPARNICKECSATDFGELVREAERSEQAAELLEKHPRRFFEERGFFVPPHALFYVIDTRELRSRLQTEQGINEFLLSPGETSGASLEAHIKGGAMNCKKIKFT